MGRAAAFVAAYALVLNVILSSLLVAGISPAAAAAGQILCINSADPGVAHDDAGKSGRGGAIHCPLCIGHHVTGALPPPAFAFGARLPIALTTVRAFEVRFVARFRSYDHQSRGPPTLT
ncbi:MAG: hypothetical protein CFE30_32660 [Bradyrhizobium sp. PARBB1]|nr:MAG: hypothetical protein CFE30_32660 [Bradyrhizobium sp. PARBB1]PSO24890.1 hypothetical protein C7G43_17575 [Bradyrhizobium sp. MOS004]HAQ82024.1 DUF2946 domain-containing protein [Bradyrhizobium sp.]HAR12836.1 DUF2946 domain-containing protein [Bradyrhizobium sp.]HAR26472.1 DUF2946 domain-containing protein [Bradyrhizobium sp.]